jgi:hypothetical protein
MEEITDFCCMHHINYINLHLVLHKLLMHLRLGLTAAPKNELIFIFNIFIFRFFFFQSDAVQLCFIFYLLF